MKTLILTALLLILSFGYSFAQETDTSEITLSFTSSETVELLKTIDTTGFTRYKIPFEVDLKVGSKASRDYLIDVSFEHITTGDTSLRIVTELFRITKAELNKGKAIHREIEIEVFHNPGKSDQVGRLKVSHALAVFNVEQHQKTLVIHPKQAEIDEVDEAQKDLELKKASINAADTIDAAKLELITVNKNNTFIKNYEPISFEVAKMTVHIDNGRFQKIIIEPAGIKGRFETSYPISATNYKNRQNDQIYYSGPIDSMKGTYVVIGHILDYSENLSKRQFPPTETVVLTPKEPSKTIQFTRNPITFFDARVYTDPTGITGNANGLVLTEVNAHFILNSANYKEFTWAPNLNMNFNWSKFDSQFDTLSLPSITDRAANTLLSLRQQANINFLFDLEVLRYSGVHESIFGIGHQLALTNVMDTAGNGNRAVTPSFSAYWRGTLFANPWIRLEMTLPVYANYNHDGIFQEYTKKWNLLIVPEIEVSIEPAKFRQEAEDEKNHVKIFARIRYFDMPNARGNNFVQFHTGVSVPITDLFK